jgi:hypothetical protein
MICWQQHDYEIQHPPSQRDGMFLLIQRLILIPGNRPFLLQLKKLYIDLLNLLAIRGLDYLLNVVFLIKEKTLHPKEILNIKY